MLHGIGGRTIAEAQDRLSYPEYIQWVKYRRQHGSLNVGQRVEQAVSQLMSLYANARRKEGAPPFKWYDFAPHHTEPAVTIAQAMESWT